MSTDNWLQGASADWNTASDWSLGAAPSITTTATIAGTGAYVVTLFGTGAAAALNLTAPGAELYDAGVLTLGGTLALQAGTLALAYGAIDGGTLALSGGTFLANGGTLSGVSIQGTLALTTAQSSLAITGGLGLAGAGGSGAGSIALTGSYATLDLIGSQTLDHATIGIGATGGQAGQTGADTLGIVAAGVASSGATLTLGTGLWLRASGGAAQIVLGSIGPGPGLPDALVNQGTITAATQGEVLTIAGHGGFTNQGTIGISNGATLAVAATGFSNTGSITLSNATFSLGGTYATSLLANLGSITLSSSTIQLAGTASNAGATLAIGRGTALGPLSLAGTIAGGTVVDSGGGLTLSTGSGVLDGVTYAGVLDLSADGACITLTDAARVTGPANLGTITDTGAGSALLLRGTETLDHVQIALGNGTRAATIATGDVWLASTATTATIGAGAFITQAGALAGLNALGWSGIPGFGAADTLVNAGTITAAYAGGHFTLGGYGILINQGAITVSGNDTLAVTAAQFANTGLLTAGQGGTILLGQTSFGLMSPAWSNTGHISVAGGTLTLGGAITTSQLGSITETSGAVILAGTLTNAGNTLSLNGGAGPLSLTALSLTGTIIGGTIADAIGALSEGAGAAAVLDGVAYRGTLALTTAGSLLRIRDGLSLAGAADILGAGATLDFQGSQVFDHAQVLLGAAGTAAALDVAEATGQSAATTLTLGPSLAITQSGQFADIGRLGGTGQPGDLIVNAGTISAAVAGGTLTLGGPGFANQGTILIGQGETLSIATDDFTNTGTIAVNGGILSIGGSLTLAQLGQLNLTNGVISVSGTLDLGGGTLSIGQGSAIGRLVLTGTITDGTITDAGGGLAPSGGATLDNVTYDGTLDLSRPFATLAIAHGIGLNAVAGTAPGAILLTGAQSRLIATTSETLDAAQVSLGSVAQYYAGQRLAAPELAAAAGVQLTLGSGVTLTLAGTSGTLGDAALGQWSDSIVNQGLITAATTGGVLNLASTFFTNTGTIATAAGGIAVFGDAGFSNTGSITVGAGSAVQITLLDYYAAPDAGSAMFTNTGTITLANGILQELTANGLFPPVPLANTGGLIIGSGILFAQVANSGTIESHGGLLQLAQNVLGSGAILIDAASTLELAATLPAGQVIQFASPGGTLKLDSPSTFTGTLGNFGAGDTLDLPGQVLTGVGLSSGTLVASTATHNYRFVGNVPLGGEVSAGHDAHGGATIAFLQQTAGTGGNSGGAPALIAVTQPNMLFWASPAGDTFQGIAATLQGAHISNWGPADNLDITDLAPGTAHLTISQGTGLDTITITSNGHTTSVGLTGTFAPSLFHISSDGHGGTVLSYGN
jgi:hypothetical protein